MRRSTIGRWAAALAVGAATLVAVPATPASATPAGDNLVINEIYNNGGSNGASYLNRYYLLYNPTSKDISVNGWSLQYKAAAATSNFGTPAPLGDKHVEPGGTLLIQGASNNSATNPGPALPTPDVVTTLNSAAGTGVVALSKSTTTLTSSLTDPNLVDLVGYGTTASLFEGTARAVTGGLTTAIKRKVAGKDTDDNAADFATATPNAVACGTVCDGPGDGGGPVDPDPGTPTTATIAEIQGTGAASPLAGKTVTTRGVVTAVYKTGGFNGGYIQTAGTGGAIDLATHQASDGVFVFDSAFAAGVEKGDFVEVTGAVSEFNGLTELTTSTGNFKKLTETAAPVLPASVSFPLSEAQRESLEGMLLLPKGDMTVTNNYTTNQYAEIGINDGKKPLQTPTNVALPGAPAKAVLAENTQRLVNLDDGSSLNFLTAVNQGTPVPWLRLGNEVRVGSAVTFVEPVVLDWRNSVWKLQPTQHLTATGEEPVTFSSTRTPKPEPVGGDVRIGTFNVLNYFPTTAADFVAASLGSCTTYKDRAGNAITANTCSPNGPRGAADADNLKRQQTKIVKAINALDANVVSLEEIENSKSVNPAASRDKALSTLVDALNADAGEQRWAFVPSPAATPSSEDVIRTAFIYQPKVVTTVGQSSILIGSDAFSNARPPLAQAFKLAGGTDASTFAVIVNHFKSKGSGTRPEDADQGDLQGASNYSRKLQATALVDFADAFGKATKTDKIFLTGDFNAYNKEEPVQILEAAKYVNVPAAKTDKETYQFDGMVGSLDHVFASPAAYERVTGADIWNINAYEALAREYSRYNYNATLLWEPTPYRASDHDPELIGFKAAPDGPVASSVGATVAGTSYGQAASVVATVTPTKGTGTVTVLEGEKTLGSAAVAAGSATVALPKDLGVGTHSLTVRYSGDTAVAASETTASVTVAKATSATKADAPGTATAGSSVDVATTVSTQNATAATGAVTLSEGGKTLGSGTLAAGKVTIATGALSAGQHTVTVAYAGDANHAGSSTSVAVTVAQQTSSVTATAAGSVHGEAASVVATVSPGAATGTVTVLDGSTELGSATVSAGKATVALPETLAAGTYQLTVTYNGSTDVAASQTTVALAVAKAGTTTSVSAPRTVRDAEVIEVGATVESATGTTPSGAVTVSEDDEVLGTGTLAAGKVSIEAGTLAIGSHTLTVDYAGDANHVASGTSAVVQVLKADVGIAATASPSTYGTSATVKVTGAPNASGLVYVGSGDTVVGLGMMTDGSASIALTSTLKPGTYGLRVFYAGNASVESSETSVSLSVAKAATSIAMVSVSPTKIVKGRTKPFVELRVTGKGFTVDGGTVTVRASGKSYTGTVKGGKVRIRLGVFTSSGSAKKVTATYAGNGVANASSTSFTVKVAKK